jgi:AcrR family transcriptional regulator
VSLDRLAETVGTSKRMLIHYFGSREVLEEKAIALLEDRLRSRFSPERFPAGVAFEAVVAALWEQSTTPGSRGVLLVIMDVSRRAWSGSERARVFYAEQQRLWVEMLRGFLPEAEAVEEFLQLFQGAILAYLITGDAEPGRRALGRFTKRQK